MVSSYLSNVVPKVYGKNALVLFFQRQGQEVAEALIEKLEREWNYDRAGGKPLTLFNMLHRAIHNNEADTSFKKKEEGNGILRSSSFLRRGAAAIHGLSALALRRR